MMQAAQLADTLLETEQWDKIHAGMEQVRAKAKETAPLYRQLQQTIQTKAPHLQPQVNDLMQRVGQRDQLLSHTGMVVAYRRALAHVGLTLDNVASKYFGWQPGKGRCIVAVRTKDDKHIKLNHPVPISEAQTIVKRLLETVDPKDFIDQNPAPGRVVPISANVWEVYDSQDQLVGRIYYENPDDMPAAAHPNWRLNPYLAMPTGSVGVANLGIQNFPTKQAALDFILRQLPAPPEPPTAGGSPRPYPNR